MLSRDESTLDYGGCGYRLPYVQVRIFEIQSRVYGRLWLLLMIVNGAQLIILEPKQHMGKLHLSQEPSVVEVYAQLIMKVKAQIQP